MNTQFLKRFIKDTIWPALKSALMQSVTNNSVVEIMWYLSGFQLSHYTEGFCSASPLEEILAYTFSRYPIKSTTAAFIKRRKCAFIFFICYISEYDAIFEYDGLIWKQFSRNHIFLGQFVSVLVSNLVFHWVTEKETLDPLSVCGNEIEFLTLGAEIACN